MLKGIFGFGKEGQAVKELRTQVAELQNSISILIGDEVVMRTTSRGNPYCTYQSAIAALAQKYEGTAEWGVQQARNVIDVRSAFIIGQGIKLTTDSKDKNSRELEFIEGLIKQNNLDEEMPQEFAKEAEIEGRCLVRLIPNIEKKQIDIRFISYSANKYTVTSSTNDYQKYEKVEYQTSSSKVVLNENEFVYKKFAGRIDKVNDIMPKVAMVLRHMEDLDKALYDWRQGNYFFGTPTPTFKCSTKEEVDKLYKTLKDVNWKIGKLLVTTAEFKLVEQSGGGITSIKEEITMLAKIISGATGVPVHFLGLPDLMSNRAVSTDLFEFINASTNKERHIWEGFYEEVFDKAVAMYNETFNSNLEPNLVKAKILSITEAKIDELARVWLPLYTANVIDLDYFLSKIPDADAEEIKKNQDARATKMLEQIKASEKEEFGEEEGAIEEGAEQ